MSADLSIDYTDGRPNVWLPVAPQSWLTDYWGPEARRQNWVHVDRLADNTLQIYERVHAEEFLKELESLRAFVVDESRSDMTAEDRSRMLERIDKFSPAVADAIASWDAVDYISGG